jgi:hypothetical protein
MASRTIIYLASIIIVFASCKKEDPVEYFQRGGNSMAQTSDGNLIIAGYNSSSGNGYDGLLMKVTTSGEMIWEKNFGSLYMDSFYNVINTSSGDYVAAGFQTLPGNSGSNIYIVKSNALGEKQWEYLGDSEHTTQGFGLVETPDNGFIACGYIQDNSYTDRDIYLVKLDASGKKVWDKRFGLINPGSTTAIYDDAYAIMAAGDSGYYLTGSINGNSVCCCKSFLMKLSGSGDSLWTKSYSLAIGYAISRTADGNIIIGGTIASNGQDAFLLKTDTAGKKIWEKSYGTSAFDIGTSVVQTQDGGYAMSGYSAKSGGSQDVSLLRINSSGTLLWSKTFGGDSEDEGYSIVKDSDGGFFIAGLTNSGGSFVFLNKTSSDGTEIWQKKLK